MLRTALQFRTVKFLPTRPMQLRSASAKAATANSTNSAVQHSEKDKQFQYLGGHLDYDIYRETVKDKEFSVMDLTHTFVPPSGRGKGIAKILCDEAFDFARQNDLVIRPSCTYISQTYIVKYEPTDVTIV